ncbi:hypothetical protein [Martelella radicis]|uniref:HlyD family secretion protein n=1 Tax=Martelella radicis TaxID=1397476 RepID=A0A7W6KHZ8_9HYPH|nr:hypothetical protein [Martelella radicis]MBB4120290.1 HlyD family secretion protein [Martelella radicis]
MPKSRETLAVLVLAAAALAAGLWTARANVWPFAGDKARSTTADLRRVAIGTHAFVRQVVRHCHVDYGAPRSIEVTADGRVEALEKQNAAVKRGDPIARFDATKLESEKKNVLLELSNLKERLAFRTGPYREQTDAIAAIERQDLTEKRDRLSQALTEIVALEKRGQIAPNRVEEARLKLGEAKTALGRFEHQQTLRKAQDALDVSQLRYTVDKTKQRLGDIRAELERAIIRAPADGRLVWTDPGFALKGEGTVRSGMTIGSIVDPEVYGARLRFIDSDMSVVDGSAVSVSFGSGRPEAAATIVATQLVDDPLEQARGRFEYAVEITFPATSHDGVLHSQAVCSFSKALGEPAPAIPAAAIMFDNGNPYARSVEGDQFGLVALELGEVSGSYVRVLSGLQPGDIVLEP